MWSHFDAGSCPGSAVGVKIILDNGVNGFLHTKNISDKHIKSPEERVKVSHRSRISETSVRGFSLIFREIAAILLGVCF